MATPTLESARLKLARAEELIDEIGAEYRESGRTPFETDVEREEIVLADGRTVQTLYRFRCRSIESPKTRWALLAGDAMHNTRAALDHLACRLVELNGGTPTNQTAFPILPHAPATRAAKDRFDARLQGMSLVHKDGIRKLQPFVRPTSDEAARLLKLAQLDNNDKHRLLTPMSATPSASSTPRVPQVTTTVPTNFDYKWATGIEIMPGVEILLLRLHDPRAIVTDVDLTMGVRVTYGDAETGLKELRRIRDYCVGIVESFAPEFS